MSIRNKSMAWAMACAVLAVSVGRASAQVKQNTDGRALDANPRVGSGGYNAQRPNIQLVSPNDILYGNTTGGRAFRDNVTGDPTQPFGGRSNLEIDRFARRSNAVQEPGAPPLPPGTYALPVYSAAPVGNAPSGFQLNPYTGQYQPLDRFMRGSADIQYGVPPGTPILRPGTDTDSQLILSTSMNDPNSSAGGSLTLTASPLLGIRPLNGLTDEDRFLLARSGDGTNLDPVVLQKLRLEMSQQIATNPQLAEEFRRADNEAAAQQAMPLTNGRTAEGRALPNNLGTGQVDSGVAATPLTGPNPGFRTAPKYDPADRNPLLAELRKAEAARASKMKVVSPPVKKADASDLKPETVTPPPTTRGAGLPRAGNTGTYPAPEAIPTAGGPATLEYVAPIQVGALSETSKQEGLKMLLASGEKLMAEGKYASAADRYEAATRFAPGDQILVVARAQAELSAGFFARSEASLRAAAMRDPSVLNAQYDLRKAIGEKRIDTLIGELKRIALDDKSGAMPVVLLAYLAYNSGDVSRAMALLHEASTRQAHDPLVVALRAHWSEPK